MTKRSISENNQVENVRKKIKISEDKKKQKNIKNLDEFIEYLQSIKNSETFFRSRYERVTLTRIIPTLKKLNKMVGMNKLKSEIINKILFYAQCLDIGTEFMMHTVIQGDPGTGKTEVARIIAEIYRKLGFLSNDKFVIAKRDDFIAGYLGQTALKTRKLLDSCDGGVLFIDEAYSMGSNDGRDSFSKEAIDLLNEYLSNNKKNFVCIIAGYKENLKKCFFKLNPGLERRFPWKYTLESYKEEELRLILKKQIKVDGWDIEDGILKNEIFVENKDYFKNNGGDTENLFQKCKIHHSHRIFLNRIDNHHPKKRLLNKEDLKNGMELHKSNYLRDIDTYNSSVQHLYL